MDIGDKIKQCRQTRNMTMEELAKAVGTTRQAIYKYENKIVTNIPLDRIEALAKTLGTTPAYLMGWGIEEISGDMGEIFTLKVREALHNSGYYLEYKKRKGELFVFIKNIDNEVVFASKNQDFLDKLSKAVLDYDTPLSFESLFTILGEDNNKQVNYIQPPDLPNRNLRSVARLQEWDDVTESEDKQLSDFIDFLRAKREKESD